MKKKEIIKLWNSKYNLDSKTTSQVLEFVLNLSKEKIFLLEEVNPIYIGQIEYIFEKLSNWFPLAYIIKKVNFFGLDFYVNENVLIPRDDTEILVREVICHCESSELNKKNWNNIVKRLLHNLQWHVLIDIWTGTGIIPICIAKSIDFEWIYAIDISESALEVAKENVFRYKFEDKISLLNSDFKNFEFEFFSWKNLIITANLPYIKEGDYKNMDFSVYNFEPKTALYGWINTWFELYQDLIEILINKKKLFNSLTIFIEIWFDQYEISKKFLEEKWLKFEIFKDTNNIDRVIKIIL